ncbi:hypothetical protein ACTA71_009608 [Dictyostelium dimigraforme]
MINALKRIPINGMNRNNFIKGVTTNTSPLLYSSSKILFSISKSNLIINNNKRYFGSNNNNNDGSNNINPNDIDTAKSFDLTSASTSASTLTQSATEPLQIIGEKVIPSYILNPTMGPDANRITEWSHQLNFDIIEIFNNIHEQFGFPWISFFVGTAVFVRICTLPLTIRNQRDAAKMRLVREDMEKMSYLNDGTTEGRIRLAEQQKKIFLKHGASPLKTLAFNVIQLPFILYPFILLRQICHDTNLLNNAGYLWFQNLSLADPFYILPFVSSIFQFISVRQTLKDGDSSSPLMKNIMSALCFLPLVFTLHFASALNIYWAVNSLIFAFTNWFLRTKRGSKLFNVPYFDKGEKIKKIIEVLPNQPETIKKTPLQDKSKLLKEVQDEYNLLEKKKQELKNFGRRNK